MWLKAPWVMARITTRAPIGTAVSGGTGPAGQRSLSWRSLPEKSMTSGRELAVDKRVTMGMPGATEASSLLFRVLEESLCLPE